MVGEKESILIYQLELLLGKCLVEIAFCQKVVVDGWDHLMHAIEVGSEKRKPLSIEARGERREEDQIEEEK